MDAVSIIIAIVSLCISMLTAGWTIYRDAIQRPSFRVSIALKTIYQGGHKPIGPDIYVEALNLGPLPNRIGVVHCWKSWLQRCLHPDNSQAVIGSDYGHMAATPSGARIEVGDRATHVFPFNADCFLQYDYVRVGVADGYGRLHWAPRKQLRAARKEYAERFGKEAGRPTARA